MDKDRITEVLKELRTISQAGIDGITIGLSIDIPAYKRNIIEIANQLEAVNDVVCDNCGMGVDDCVCKNPYWVGLLHKEQCKTYVEGNCPVSPEEYEGCYPGCKGFKPVGNENGKSKGE